MRKSGGLLAFLGVLALLVPGCRAPSEVDASQASPVQEESPVVEDRIEARLTELGVELPTPGAPVANYVRAVRSGNLVFLAGHIPRNDAGEVILGKLGVDLTVEQGYLAARQSAIALLGSLAAEIGDLDRVTRIVNVTGMVNSAPDFVEQSQVINGCSDFLVEVFGERARHARAAVGMASLPLGAAVEIEMVVEVR